METLYRHLLPIIGSTVRFNPDPFPAGGTRICWPPWDFDSCLALATAWQLRRPRLGRTLFDARTQDFEEKAMPLPEEQKWRSYLGGYEKTDTANAKDGVHEFCSNRNHASKGGSTPDPLWRWMDFEKTPKPNLFLSSLSESRGRDSFKGGRFVTSQNFKFWNVIINR